VFTLTEFADFFTSIASVRFVWLFLVMLLAYTVTYILWAIAWYILSETTTDCVEGIGSKSFLAAYMFSVESQVRLAVCMPSPGTL
jgi:uncharacterized membrane protein YbhN (UPF0104 family)